MKKRNVKANKHLRWGILCTLMAPSYIMAAPEIATEQPVEVEVECQTENPDQLQLKVGRRDQSDKPLGLPNKRNPIRIPKVTKDGHTFYFITPCMGLTFQLVQGDEVCYETVITADSLEIPADITGVYELQILRGEFTFFAEIEL